MRQEDLTTLAHPFKIDEGAEYFVVYSLDDGKLHLSTHMSSGYPMKVLELHSKDNERVLATVFSYKFGKRFMIAFNITDMRPL